MNTPLLSWHYVALFSLLFFGAPAHAQLKLNQAQNSQTTAVSAQTDRTETSSDDHSSGAAHTSPFDAVKDKKEDMAKRDAFSKHYINEDGSYTALIGAGPIHYEKNGHFYDIDHSIISNSDADFSYANTSNLFESYFGRTAHTGIKNKTAEGEVTEFLNTRMYWEVNGRAVNEMPSADVSVSVQDDKAYYNNMYGNIAAEFVMLTGKRELNYIIPSRLEISNAPANAEYLVFTEDVKLPEGWTSKASDNGILILNPAGKEMYLYENPVSTDAANALSREKNTVFETELNGNILTIMTKVKTEWLLSNERQFPVKVDPTVNVYPDNFSWWSGEAWDDGYDATGDLTVGRYNFYPGIYWVAGFVRFNLASIPNNSIVNNATGFINVTSGTGVDITTRQWAFTNSADPLTSNNLHSSMQTALSQSVNVTSLGWKNSIFSSEGKTYLQNGINENYTSLGVFPMGIWQVYTNQINGTYFEADGYDSTNRPYLQIDYTITSNCSGTPTGGTASIDPNSGTHGEGFSISVDGSTNEGGITYQWEISESSSGPWTEISGATNNTYSGEAPYENGTTYYRRKITCTNSNESAYSTEVAFTTTCTPSHIEGNAPDDNGTYFWGYVGISNVNIGTINNTTGYRNESPAYNYYNISTDAEVEETYELKVTYKDDGGFYTPANYNPGKIGVWVDWNEDGDFNDADEFIGVQSNIAHNAQVTFNITVPANTTAGIKRLRVRSAYYEEDVTSQDACTILVYGETEDYNLNVLVTEPDYDFVYHNDTVQWEPNYPGDSSNNPSTATSTILVKAGTATFNTDIVAGDLTVNAGANLNVEKILKLNGNNLINNGHITFKSSSVENTAQFDVFNGDITGDGLVTTERFIPARRSFRFLSSAVTTETTIRENWQEEGDNTPGWGTHITGNGGASNGFDPTNTNNPSMFELDDTAQAWVSVENTNVTTLGAGTPYRIMVRGDRTLDLSTNTPTPTPTVLRATGMLRTGEVEFVGNVSINEGQHFFVGNPYQAAVNTGSLLSNAINVKSEFYHIWDPQLNGENGRGAYVTVDMFFGEPNNENSKANQYLQPGQAILLEGTTTGGVPSVLFKEEYKNVEQDLTTTFNMISRLSLQLYYEDNYENGETATDGISIRFFEDGNNDVDDRDASKMGNLDENLAIQNGNKYLSIETRAYPENEEIISLFINKYRTTNYVLQGRFAYPPEQTTAYLYDRFTNTHTELSEEGAVAYSFEVDPGIDGSIDSNRFEIHFSVEPLIGVDDITLSSVALYPNPFHDNSFNIAAKGLEGQRLDVQIVNMIGQVIYSETVTVSSDGNAVVQLANSIASGVYNVKITSEDQHTISKKLIKN